MLGTGVPETAIDEDGDFDSRKDKISLPAKGRDWSSMYEVAEPHLVKTAPNVKLRPSIALPLLLHSLTNSRRRCEGGNHDYGFQMSPGKYRSAFSSGGTTKGGCSRGNGPSLQVAHSRSG